MSSTKINLYNETNHMVNVELSNCEKVMKVRVYVTEEIQREGTLTIHDVLKFKDADGNIDIERMKKDIILRYAKGYLQQELTTKTATKLLNLDIEI